MYQYIKVEEAIGWANIKLDRAKKYNALRPQMCEEIAQAAESLAARSDIKCIVISGEGKHFCAGYDVATELEANDSKAIWVANRRIQDAFARLNALPVVTICALQGYVIGAGMLLAAVCNLRYATADATFYIPELDMGIPFSLGGVATIARYIGITRTTELVLTCNRITADSSYMDGFVTRVVESDQLMNHVGKIAKGIAERPNSLILSSLSTIREAERGLMPNPASDLFTMLFVDMEEEAKSVREGYSKRFKG